MYKPAITSNLSIVASSYRSKCSDKQRVMKNRSKTQLKKLSDCFYKTIKSLDEIAREDVEFTKTMIDKWDEEDNDIDIVKIDKQDPFDV